MSRNILKKVSIFLSLTTIAFLGCTKKESSSDQKVLNIAVWANYLTPEMAQNFTQKTGIKLNISNYTSNEELLAKIQAGGSGYDVIFPSDYMVEIMTKLNLLQPLDKSKIPNFANIESKFLGKPFDTENKFSVPFNFGTSGITYNKAFLKKDYKSWKQVLNDKQLDGKVSLLDDVRESMAVALKVNGASINSTLPADLEKAKATLLAFKKKIKMFRTEVKDPLLSKEVLVAHAYSSDALQTAAKSNGDIAYALAEEGGSNFIDAMAVLKDSKHAEEAHTFINYFLDADVNANFVKTSYGTPIIKGVKEKLPPELQKMDALFPTDAALSKFEGLQDIGEATQQVDKIWTEVKTE